MTSPPKDALKEVYLWADYVELRCLVSLDQELTLEDLVATLRQDPEESPDADGVDEDVSQEVDSEAAESGQSPPAASKVDNRFRLAGEVFDLLETRFLLYDDAYPFELGADRIRCASDMTPLRRTYVFLLLCSLGRYVTQHGQLAKSFERLCSAVISVMVPGSEVHIFGTAQQNGSKFSGNFKSRARDLAEFLGETLQPAAEKISALEGGDRGLDIVASLDPGDLLASRLVIFGQAATGRDWHVKQRSVASQSWDAILQVTSPAVAACLIPLCFRDVAAEWHDSTLIHRSWVLDRFRIVHQMRRRLSANLDFGWENGLAVEIVDGVLKYRVAE